MELTGDTNTNNIVSSPSNVNTNTNTNSSVDITAAVTTANHHFMKRINESPSKGQQAKQPVQQNILQAHIEQHQQHQQHQHQHPHQRQQQEQTQLDMDGLTSGPSPKPNQVGTVLLYGIPIVSLYIDSKERLCLAQISNTLLKQFSYNEIHNRRVALGITCVQCTPVQLEILRRAGAMPVSSRRCGMITRREAERLCKSFLGDNAPPRLPDDFAFSVHHKCAWGCRGSFLPSRYNSSRAKCIKCSFCGLFFSPNKFIFHSHRIGPGDKYVQPDAANFNSWRRHMKLSGSPPEEIIHAWEDVKAMFNGGTRKRLMTSTNSSSSLAASTAPTNVTAGSSASSSSSSSSSSIAAQSPKRLKEGSPGRNGGSANPVIGQFPLRPLNVHHHHNNAGASSAATANVIATHSSVSSTPSEITLPFSRNFMMDYMWHAHTQTKSGNHFHFPNCTLPWIKASTGSLIFGNNNSSASVAATANHDHALNSSTNLEGSNRSNSSPSASIERFNSPPHGYSASASVSASAVSEVKTLSGFYNNSAFKPVIQGNRSAASYSAATTNLALETVAAVAAAAAAAATSYDNEQQKSAQLSRAVTPSPGAATIIKESFSSDDEMVDIETTEEEEKSYELDQQNQRMKLIKKDEPSNELRNTFATNLDAPIDVDNSNDELQWKGILKKEQSTHHIETCRMQTPSSSSLLSHSPASSINSEHHASFHLANKSASSTPDVILSGSPGPNCSSSSNIIAHDRRHNCSPEQQRNVAAALASAFNHHRQHHLHHHQSQQPLSPQLPPPLPTVTASASLVNGSPSLSPGTSAVSLVSGRLTADVASNSSMLFGAISGCGKNTSPFLISGTGNNDSSTPNPSCTSMNGANNSNTNNNNNNNTNLIINSGNTAIPPCVNNEFWSVARLSLNRPPNEYNAHYRLPITAAFHRHHHDITKHFQAFRHHGHETPTQTNGVG